VSEDWRPADHGSETGPLQSRVARGLAWTLVDHWGSQLFNLAVFVLLARLLIPDDFGLVALAAVFVAFAQLIVDQGLGDALIQRREVTRSHIDTAFWVAVATAAVLTLIGVLLAIPLAAVLGEPELQPIIQVLSLTFVLSAVTSVQVALLRRELAFRSLAIRSLLAAVVGGVVSVPMAYLGFGAWALVGQQVAAALASVVSLWAVSPWRPSLRASGAHFRELFSFGAHVVGSDVLNFLGRNSDNLLVGVVLGPTALGFYAVGYRILEVTQRMLVNVARKITFPALSRLQDDRDRLRRAYLRVTRVSSALILPGYLGLALVAPELMRVLFGHRWEMSGPVAAILFLTGPVLTLQAFSGSLLNAAGHPEVTLRFRLISSVVNIVGFVIAVPFGITAVAAAFVVRAYLLLPLILRWMHRYVGLSVREYLAQLPMVAAVLAVKLVAADLGFGARLLGETVAGAAAFGLVLWAVEGPLVHEVLTLARQALPGRRPRPASEARGEPVDTQIGWADRDDAALPLDDV